MQPEGEVDVKGKGMMRTYFLEENQGAAMREIIGQDSSYADVTQICEGENCVEWLSLK